MAPDDQIAQLDNDLAQIDGDTTMAGANVAQGCGLFGATPESLFETEHDVPASNGGEKVRFDLHPELAKIAPHLVCAATYSTHN